jgi:hypothetical protein
MKAVASAIREAKQELKYVSSEMTAYAVRREQLEAFIESARVLAGGTLRPQPKAAKPSERVASAKTPSSSEMPQVHAWPETPRKSNAQMAMDALNKIRHPMTIQDIVDTLAKQGTPIRGEFQNATLRSAMGSKPQVFEKVSPGVWALREWPADLKQLKQSRVQ